MRMDRLHGGTRCAELGEGGYRRVIVGVTVARAALPHRLVERGEPTVGAGHRGIGVRVGVDRGEQAGVPPRANANAAAKLRLAERPLLIRLHDLKARASANRSRCAVASVEHPDADVEE